MHHTCAAPAQADDRAVHWGVPDRKASVSACPRPSYKPCVHNFSIDELDIQSGDVQGGQTVSGTINAAPGEYELYCSIPGHRESGVVGTLIVD